jgi:hypothetical protein
MSEFVKKTMIGYKEVPGGQSDPECSHVILTLKEYEGLLQKISQAEQETRNEKRRAEEEKGASLYREQQTIQKANQAIEKWMKALEKEKAESAYQKGLNENLLRIARERANADRKLKPKKEHTGYVVVVSSEKIYRYKNRHRLESVKLWETVIQSPYSIEFPAEQAKRMILEEFFPETGEWEAARLGIKRWVAGDYEDFLSAADKDEEFMKQNAALTGYRSFRANYRAGYWEMILVHTKPLEVVPKDMRVS